MIVDRGDDADDADDVDDAEVAGLGDKLNSAYHPK